VDVREVVEVRRGASEAGVVGGGVGLAGVQEGPDVLESLLVDNATNLHGQALHAPRRRSYAERHEAVAIELAGCFVLDA